MSHTHSIAHITTSTRLCHISALYTSLLTLGYVTYPQHCTSSRLCYVQHCTHHYIHYTKSWAHSITYCATYITALSCAIALCSAAHMPSHALYLQHCTCSGSNRLQWLHWSALRVHSIAYYSMTTPRSHLTPSALHTELHPLGC